MWPLWRIEIVSPPFLWLNLTQSFHTHKNARNFSLEDGQRQSVLIIQHFHQEMAKLPKWKGHFIKNTFNIHQLCLWFVHEYLLPLPPFQKSSPDHSTYRHNTTPTAVQQYTHSQPTDSKLLLSFPTTPCLRSQPPAKQTVLEISLQITLCLPNPLRAEQIKTQDLPAPTQRPDPHSCWNHVDCIFVYNPNNCGLFFFLYILSVVQNFNVWILKSELKVEMMLPNWLTVN